LKGIFLNENKSSLGTIFLQLNSDLKMGVFSDEDEK
jgi:hypothetical protein